MSRPVTLFTGQWADLPIEELATKSGDWGFDGLELACWGDHFEVDKALADDGYAKERRALLERHGLGVWALGAHLVGQAVCDRIDERHRAILPPEVYGDGEEEGVRRRAAERMQDTARAAARLAHPNVCVIHDVGLTEDGRHFIAMEYVEGADLAANVGEDATTAPVKVDLLLPRAIPLKVEPAAP